MKIIIIFYLLVAFPFTQTIDDLTTDQKLVYNRNKLSVKTSTQTYGGISSNSTKTTYGSVNSGNYSGGSYDTWQPYKGLGGKISKLEFFEITGYEIEAEKIRNNIEIQKSRGKARRMRWGGCCGLYSFVMLSSDSSESNGNVIGALLVASLVTIYMSYSKLKSLPSVQYFDTSMPYSAVKPIVEDYNKRLIKNIINNRF